MDFFSFSIFFSYGCLTLSLFLAMYRLLVGPTLPDRIVVLDLLVSLLMGFAIVYALHVGQPIYLNVVIVLALLSFLGNIAFAKYLQRNLDG